MWHWLESHRGPIILFLIALILIGGAIFAYRWVTPSGALEITVAPREEITVHISGEVASPGVYKLPDGACLDDAIKAAGGFTSDAYTQELNLAQKLRDGDRIHIYRPSEVPQKVNINTADAWLLEALPGIGEVRAQKIIESRTTEGLFTHPYDLVERKLIPQSVFDDIEDLIKI